MNVLDAIARSIHRNRMLDALLDAQEGEDCAIQNGVGARDPRGPEER